MFAAFNCRKLDEEKYYLVENLEIECWKDEWLVYALCVAMPSILVWGIGAPGLCLFVLMKRFKLRLKDIDVKIRLGFLYNGYEEQTFYWEFIILYRKIAIIACSVFLGAISIPIQALTVLIVLIISLHIQNQVQPFDRYDLNQMELRAIMVATVTIYCGLYYLTDHLDYASKVILFVVMIAINVYFLIYWIQKMLGAGVYYARDRITCLQSIIRANHVEDGYDDALTVNQGFAKQLRIVGRQKQYQI
jgi:hypothetical protein